MRNGLEDEVMIHGSQNGPIQDVEIVDVVVEAKPLQQFVRFMHEIRIHLDPREEEATCEDERNRALIGAETVFVSQHMNLLPQMLEFFQVFHGRLLSGSDHFRRRRVFDVSREPNLYMILFLHHALRPSQ